MHILLIVAQYQRFLSTLSLRRATVIPGFKGGLGDNFYPRSPCGERLSTLSPLPSALVISIHALLAESDPDDTDNAAREEISIHALLAESDTSH